MMPMMPMMMILSVSSSIASTSLICLHAFSDVVRRNFYYLSSQDGPFFAERLRSLHTIYVASLALAGCKPRRGLKSRRVEGGTY